jgi:hypothetical protein
VNDSPYLKPGRLADVVAALQALSTYKFYKLTFEDWADRLSADKSQTDRWKLVFLEHSEFFRLDGNKEKVSLVWRRQFPKRYDVDTERTISVEEFEAYDSARKERVSRNPLSAGDIEVLLKTAVDLHARALEEKKESRWWVPLATAILGAIVGLAIGKQ